MIPLATIVPFVLRNARWFVFPLVAVGGFIGVQAESYFMADKKKRDNVGLETAHQRRLARQGTLSLFSGNWNSYPLPRCGSGGTGSDFWQVMLKRKLAAADTR